MVRWVTLLTVFAAAGACEEPTGVQEAPSFAITGTDAGCFIIPEGLVSWWPAEGHFDDVVGENHANDFLGVTFDAGVVGQGFKYTGSGGQYIEIPDAPSLRLQEFTVELWVTKVGLGEAEDHWGSSIVAKSATLTPWVPRPGSFLMMWRSLVDDRITASVLFEDDQPYYGRPPIRLVSSSTFPLPATVHAALTYDGSLAKLYVNGVLEAEYDAGSRIVNQGPGGLTFGQNPKWSRDLGYRHTHNGIFDEIGLFDRALSQAEIQAIYDAGTAGKAISPEQALQSLLEKVVALELNRGLENALSATLDAAAASLGNDRPATIQQLGAFINQVEALRGNLLTDSEADELIEEAQAIIQVIVNCG